MRTESRTDSRLFGELLRGLLKQGISARFQARGRSMFPAIGDGDEIQVDAAGSLQRGDVALVETADGLRAHRVIRGTNAVATRGDCCFEEDPLHGELVGVVSTREGDDIPKQRFGSVLRRWVARWRGHF